MNETGFELMRFEIRTRIRMLTCKLNDSQIPVEKEILRDVISWWKDKLEKLEKRNG